MLSILYTEFATEAASDNKGDIYLRQANTDMTCRIDVPRRSSCITRPDAFVRRLAQESGSRVWVIGQIRARFQRSGNEKKASSRGELTMLAIERRESLVHLAAALRVEQP